MPGVCRGMSAREQCPERVAVETLSGTVRAGPVVACETRVVGHRPVEFLTVALDGHTLEVPAEDATRP